MHSCSSISYNPLDKLPLVLSVTLADSYSGEFVLSLSCAVVLAIPFKIVEDSNIEFSIDGFYETGSLLKEYPIEDAWDYCITYLENKTQYRELLFLVKGNL